MEFLEKPQGYWYWFKQVIRMCFPMKQDFHGLGSALWQTSCKLTHAVLKCLSRLLLLMTLPLSVPLLTILFVSENERVMKHRAKRLSEEWDGFPPEFTKEEVQKVLDGEITLEQLRKEKEDEWDS